MAKITREQINKINSKCENGFNLDVKYYLMRNDKELVKYIDMSEGRLLEAKLCYMDDVDKIVQDNGITYNQRNGKQRLTIHISLWSKACESGFRSSGMGKFIKLDNVQDKKLMSVLQKNTSIFTDSKILELYNSYVAEVNNKILGVI